VIGHYPGHPSGTADGRTTAFQGARDALLDRVGLGDGATAVKAMFKAHPAKCDSPPPRRAVSARPRPVLHNSRTTSTSAVPYTWTQGLSKSSKRTQMLTAGWRRVLFGQPSVSDTESTGSAPVGHKGCAVQGPVGRGAPPSGGSLRNGLANRAVMRLLTLYRLSSCRGGRRWRRSLRSSHPSRGHDLRTTTTNVCRKGGAPPPDERRASGHKR